MPDVRYQRKCYFASAEYSESFWGKFVYIYQGKGSLRLTPTSLRLEGCRGAVDIPFHAVESVRLGRFSSWSKPGLYRLTVRFERAGERRTIHLTPYESVLDPVWVTSELVASWHETLGRVPDLSGRVRPSDFPPEPAPSAMRRLLVAVGLVLPALVAWLFFWGVADMSHRPPSDGGVAPPAAAPPAGPGGPAVEVG